MFDNVKILINYNEFISIFQLHKIKNFIIQT